MIGSSLLALSCTQEKHPAEAGHSFAAIQSLKQGTTYGFGDQLNNTYLNIRSVHDTGFGFTLEAVSGADDYQVEGVAQFVNDSQASYKEDSEVVQFTIRGNFIVVSEKGSSGMAGINFNGEYRKGFSIPDAQPASADISFLDPQVNMYLKSRSRAHYSDLSDCMARYSEEEDVKDAAGYKMYSGGINGQFTLDEAKILTKDRFYYAGLVVDDTVHLYTNDPMYLKDQKILPPVIEKWIPEMAHSQVTYHY